MSGDFDICEVKAGYTFIIPKSEHKAGKSKPVSLKRSNAGALLFLIRNLKKLEEDGVDYYAINQYFRDELLNKSSSMIGAYIVEILTYDPRDNTPKSYADVYAALRKAPSSLNWLEIWDVIDGLSVN